MGTHKKRRSVPELWSYNFLRAWGEPPMGVWSRKTTPSMSNAIPNEGLLLIVQSSIKHSYKPSSEASKYREREREREVTDSWVCEWSWEKERGNMEMKSEGNDCFLLLFGRCECEALLRIPNPKLMFYLIDEIVRL